VANPKFSMISPKNNGDPTALVLTPELLAVIKAAVRVACGPPDDPRPWRGGELHPADARMAYSIDDLSRRSGVGRQLIYDEINAGHLLARKIGRRTIILATEGERWLADAPAIEPAAATDILERALPSATFELEPMGTARSPIKNRAQRRRGEQNVPTPPAPPVAQVRDSRIVGQERSQQNAGFLARHRRDERGADTDVTPPGAARASVPPPVDRQRRNRARVCGHAGDPR
jgi:hypothetical protein